MIVDLIMFEMPGFDMILGIDFFNRYRVEINYKGKNVKSNLDNGDKFLFGEGRPLSRMISNIKTYKMLSKECIGYLAHVVSKSDSKSTLSMEDTSAICEFLNVFLNNLPRLATRERGRV